eukprot:7574-Amphidinium_carterae.2
MRGSFHPHKAILHPTVFTKGHRKAGWVFGRTECHELRPVATSSFVVISFHGGSKFLEFCSQRVQTWNRNTCKASGNTFQQDHVAFLSAV